MSIAEDVLRCSKKLGQIMAGELPDLDALAILQVLKEMKLTVEVLHKTRIGMTVNELRKKIKIREVQTEAKNLIRSWKKLIDTKSTKTDVSGAGLKKNDSVASNLSDMSRSSGTSPPPPAPVATVTVERRSPVRGASKCLATGSELRDKSRQMIYKSLESDRPPPGVFDIRRLADEIEEAIFNAHTDTTKYKNAIRSRVFNLRDKKNPELKEHVLTGVIPPYKLATMTTEEMASEAVKELRKKFTKEAINEHQLAHEVGTPTDMFKCGKCKKKNCTYTQAQTRSADEPMTTFVFCRECGNRWKFC